jgi:pimeloyl-ACP methyl ester carboxylesterase
VPAPTSDDPARTLAGRLEAALVDAEARAAQAGLTETIALAVGGASLGLVPSPGGYRVVSPAPPNASVRVVGDPGAWSEALEPVARAGAHSFTALRRSGRLRTEGDPLALARSLFLLERLLEVVRGGPAARPALAATGDVGQIQGRYHRLVLPGGSAATVYAESAGSGVPVVFLHTAGADSRQYQALLADVELARRFQLHAFDLPMHGRSMPPEGWDGGLPVLTQQVYAAWCVAFLDQVMGAPAIVVGCSMGAAMSLVLAATRPDLVLGVIAVEAPFRAKGRLSPYLAHAGVNAAAHNPSYVRGLMSPVTPEAARRSAAWIYGQGGLGVYAGDLVFYEQFDGGDIAPRIDGARCPVAFLAGAYDYSATPDDARRLASLIGGATIDIMPDLGHFPMVEDPDRFRAFFVPALERIAARHGET